ncbi:MAG: DUF4214 domain-containing protein [Acidimicrobiales bacterium]
MVALLPVRAGAVTGSPEESAEGNPTTAGATRDFGFLPPRPTSEKYVRPIMFPVLADPTLGTVSWSDTYLAPRSDGRKHEGQDLLGKKMLKLLAVCNATVVELRHQAGGNSLYLKGDDGWYYCYLHINNDDPGTDNGANQFQHAFAPGLAVGSRVRTGDLVGFVGDSGNAESVGPMLHFEIRMPNAKWYNAAAVNASYSLAAATPAKLRPRVSDAAFAPHVSAKAFATAMATDFVGSVPSASWLSEAEADLEGAAVSLDAFVESLLDLPGAARLTAPTIRLYLGFFLRIPDYPGLDYWIRKVRSGTSLDTAASQFAGGTEFARRYGALDNPAYVSQLYRNLFARDPDPSGLDYWVRRLDGGAKRGWVMRQMCESSEYQRKTASQVRVIQVYMALLQRAPDASGYAYWSSKDAASSTGLQQLIKSIRTGTGYAARY